MTITTRTKTVYETHNCEFNTRRAAEEYAATVELRYNMLYDYSGGSHVDWIMDRIDGVYDALTAYRATLKRIESGQTVVCAERFVNCNYDSNGLKINSFSIMCMEVETLLRHRRLINAIKMVRDCIIVDGCRFGLKEAKDYVEGVRDRMRANGAVDYEGLPL